MKVTLIGSGNMGSGLAKQITKAKHSLTITGRNVAKAKDLAQLVGASYQASDAARAADVVILAVPYGDALPALRLAGSLQGKIVIDITNPLTADYMGLTVGHSTSAAEQIQQAVPEAKVVKAFNTVFAQVLSQGPLLEGKTVPVFFAGDDASAKQAAQSLIQSMGFAPVDAGPLKNSRYLEPLAGLNIYLGYGAGHGTSISPAWIGIR